MLAEPRTSYLLQQRANIPDGSECCGSPPPGAPACSAKQTQAPQPRQGFQVIWCTSVMTCTLTCTAFASASSEACITLGRASSTSARGPERAVLTGRLSGPARPEAPAASLPASICSFGLFFPSGELSALNSAVISAGGTGIPITPSK